MADFRITDLQVQTQLTEDSWVATDNTTTGYRRFNLKSVSDAASAANTAATAAMAAKTAADAAKASADAAAEDAAEAATSAESRIDAAIDAIGDISELAVPLMSSDTRGGAKLEEHGGLALRDGALGIGSLVQESDGYARGGLAEVTAKGHAEQFSTTGKNLLPRMSDRTMNGITWMVNADGSVTANGTASADSVDSIIIELAAGTYTMGAGIDTSQNETYNGYVQKSVDGSYVTIARTSGDLSPTFTLSEDTTVRFLLRVMSGKTVSNLIFYPQLELGSTATDYEPYTGGAPSPSPDYPQEIQVVRGRNLLPKMASQTISGITATVTDDGTITLNGTATATAFFYTPCDIEAGIYTLSANNPASSSTGNLVFKLVDGQIVDIYGASRQINAANTIESITTAVEAKSWVIRVASGASFSNFKLKPQLTLGSTPQPYVPYGHVGMEVQGKNLLNLDGLLAGVPSLTIGDSISNITSSTRYAYLPPIDASKGLFVTAHSLDVSNVDFCVFLLYNNDVLVNRYYLTITGATPATLATAADTYEKAVIVFGAITGVAVLEHIDAIKASITLGSTATAYEPYFHITTPIPLPSRGWVGSLPDGTADTLTLDGAGKVEWDLVDEETTTAATDGVTGTVGTDVLSTTGQIADGATVLYKLATPVTEDCGYCEDWPTDIPEGATVTIPELDALGISYFVDSAVTELARQWYARANSEYESRLTALEQAVAELATS